MRDRSQGGKRREAPAGPVMLPPTTTTLPPKPARHPLPHPGWMYRDWFAGIRISPYIRNGGSGIGRPPIGASSGSGAVDSRRRTAGWALFQRARRMARTASITYAADLGASRRRSLKSGLSRLYRRRPSVARISIQAKRNRVQDGSQAARHSGRPREASADASRRRPLRRASVRVERRTPHTPEYVRRRRGGRRCPVGALLVLERADWRSPKFSLQSR